MAQFDAKEWNDKVFQKYLQMIPSARLNSFMKAGILVLNQKLAKKLPDEVGGNYIVEPIKGRLDGQVLNYDGVTDMEATSRDTFMQGKIVVGRMKAWQEKDFSTDISGEEFLPIREMSGEVAEYYEGVDQDDIMAILEGIFGMSSTAGAQFVEKHTNDITEKGDGKVSASTLNRTITKASGDRKSIFKLVIMNSEVAATLEDLQLVEYAKYTDENGIEKELGLATWNGRIVIVDDDAPVEEGYFKAQSTTEGAIKVVAFDATAGEIKLADVKKAEFYPEDVKANDYVVAGLRYISYVLGNGAIEYANCGAKVPSEMGRNPEKNGGITLLYTRQRKLYAPKWISFTKANMATLSPTIEELKNGANWEIVNNGQTGQNLRYVNHKFIPIARIISKA